MFTYSMQSTQTGHMFNEARVAASVACNSHTETTRIRRANPPPASDQGSVFVPQL